VFALGCEAFVDRVVSLIEEFEIVKKIECGIRFEIGFALAENCVESYGFFDIFSGEVLVKAFEFI